MFEHFFFARELSLLAILSVLFAAQYANYFICEVLAGAHPYNPFLKPTMKYCGKVGPKCETCKHRCENKILPLLSTCDHPLARNGADLPYVFFVRGETKLYPSDNHHRHHVKAYGICGIPGLLYEPAAGNPENHISIKDAVKWLLVRYALVQDFVRRLRLMQNAMSRYEKEILLTETYDNFRQKRINLTSYNSPYKNLNPDPVIYDVKPFKNIIKPNKYILQKYDNESKYIDFPISIKRD